jgi:hypothetical protein
VCRARNCSKLAHGTVELLDKACTASTAAGGSPTIGTDFRGVGMEGSMDTEVILMLWPEAADDEAPVWAARCTDSSGIRPAPSVSAVLADEIAHTVTRPLTNVASTNFSSEKCGGKQ